MPFYKMLLLTVLPMAIVAMILEVEIIKWTR